MESERREPPDADHDAGGRDAQTATPEPSDRACCVSRVSVHCTSRDFNIAPVLRFVAVWVIAVCRLSVIHSFRRSFLVPKSYRKQHETTRKVRSHSLPVLRVPTKFNYMHLMTCISPNLDTVQSTFLRDRSYHVCAHSTLLRCSLSSALP